MPAHRVPRVQLFCAYRPCAKPFEVTPGDADRVRYCSPTCRSLARQQPRVFPQMLTCAYAPCSQTFAVLPWQAESAKFCSHTCYLAQRADPVTQLANFATRFWSKVDKTPGYGPKGVCWLWRGAIHANGYGNFRATPYHEGNVSAHIVSWFLKTGEWSPEGLFILHSCDVRLCVNNEACLFLGTHTDNMQDMLAKGRQGALTHPERVLRGDAHPARLHPERMASGDRHGSRVHPERVPRGERNGMSKLTDAQWQEALALYATGEWSQVRLAARYGLSNVAIGRRLRVHYASIRQAMPIYNK